MQNGGNALPAAVGRREETQTDTLVSYRHVNRVPATPGCRLGFTAAARPSNHFRSRIDLTSHPTIAVPGVASCFITNREDAFAAR